MKLESKEEIEEQIAILRQKSPLDRRERRYLAKLEAKLKPAQKSNFNWRKLAANVFFGFIVILIIGGIGWYLTTRPNFPPIDLSGHIEENPASHILDTEMPEPIQKHMLEHADGKGAPGVIIQYNCKKYNCEKNLIDKLKILVKKYPENVYLAPGNYDGQIILTKLGKRLILENFNSQKIDDFIKN